MNQMTFDLGDTAPGEAIGAPSGRPKRAPGVSLPSNMQTRTKDRQAALRKPPPCDIDKLRTLLSYAPETGELRWLPRPLNKGWTARFAGKIALTSVVRGTRQGAVYSQHQYAHRVAYALHNGRWPEGEMIARNGDLTDLRADNLLTTSPSLISQREAKKTRKNNTSGFPGVSFHKPSGRWQAHITIAGKHIALGRFGTPKAAAQARHRYEARHGLTASQIEARIAAS